MERPKIILKIPRRDLFAFGIADLDTFLEASKLCLTFDEFCIQESLKRRPQPKTFNDYLTTGLNAANDALRYLPHKRLEIEALRKQLSLHTFANDVNTIMPILKGLEAIGVRVFWPETEDVDMKEAYETYLENIRFQEYTNRRNSRLFQEASEDERKLM